MLMCPRGKPGSTRAWKLFRRATKVGCSNCRFYRHQCEGKCRAMVLANGGKIANGKLIGRDPYCFGGLMTKERSSIEAIDAP